MFHKYFLEILQIVEDIVECRNVKIFSRAESNRWNFKSLGYGGVLDINFQIQKYHK